MVKPLTPSQTIGPFFHEGLEWMAPRADGGAPRDGHEWLVVGTLTDANGDGVPDAMLEIWQPGRPPTLNDPAPAGFQRVYTAPDGSYTFTIRCPLHEAAIAHVTVFARGLLGALRTRLYVEDSLDRLRAREELRQIPDARLATLLPASVDTATRTIAWPIRLQGEWETVFFELR